MIKELLFTAALLFPGLAYGANPSANLSVQVVPAGTNTSAQCPGVAPAEAQAAGFTTLVFCQDFTQQIPNTAGGALNPNGTPANWLGCVSGDGPDRLWWPEGNNEPCDPLRMKQETDPTAGKLAMHFMMPTAGHPGGFVLGGSNLNTIRMDNLPGSPTGTGTFSPYPIASYVEITYRDNLASFQTDCGEHQVTSDFFSGSHERGPNPPIGVMEIDFFENWSGGVNCSHFQFLAATDHNWAFSGACNQQCANGSWYGGHNMPPQVNTDPHFFDNYHTYGTLTTTDGSTNLWTCAYVDHVIVAGGCYSIPGGAANWCTDPNPPTPASNQSQCYGQRSELWFWWGDQHNDGGFDQHYWVESWRVWSCPAWNAGGDPRYSRPGVNTCYGTMITH